MTTGQYPIGEDDLHAYVDGFLDSERRLIVERYLAEHPEAAVRIAGWQSTNKVLRNLSAWKAQEPVPAALNVGRLIEARVARSWAPWRMAAGILIALAIGAGSGWVARGPGVVTGVASVAQEAAQAHRIFAADPMHPVEFKADQRAQLVNWISARLGRSVTPPDLSRSGYRLMGGRLVATPQGPACMFLYDGSNGTRITLFIRPMERRDMNAPMRPVQAQGAAGFAWARNGLGFGLVASDPTAALHGLANTVRDDMRAAT